MACCPRLPVSSTWYVNLAYATLLLPLALCLSPCPEIESPSLNDKVEGSQVVVQGQVGRQVKVKDSYVAEVAVQCVFKGGPVSSAINVTVTGKEEGRCVQLDLSRGHVYLLYLNREGEAGSNAYTPTFIQDPAERKYLDELKFSCGLKVQLPTGITESDTCQPEKFVLDYELEGCADNNAHSASPITVSSSLRAHLLSLTCLLLLYLFL